MVKYLQWFIGLVIFGLFLGVAYNEVDSKIEAFIIGLAFGFVVYDIVRSKFFKKDPEGP